MIKVGDILKEKEDSERLSIITKIKNDDSLIEVHMIAEDGEVRIIMMKTPCKKVLAARLYQKTKMIQIGCRVLLMCSQKVSEHCNPYNEKEE